MNYELKIFLKILFLKPTVICELSLLVLYSVLRGFSPGTPIFPSHQKPTFDEICCDSVWFVVSSISKATVLGEIHWDLNKVIIIVSRGSCPFSSMTRLHPSSL